MKKYTEDLCWTAIFDFLEIHSNFPSKDWNLLMSLIEEHDIDVDFIFNEVGKIVQPSWTLMQKTLFVISNILKTI